MEVERRNLFKWSDAYFASAYDVVLAIGGAGVVPVVTEFDKPGPFGDVNVAASVVFEPGGVNGIDLSRWSKRLPEIYEGTTYTFSIWLKVPDGQPSETLEISIAGGGLTAITVTDSWQRFSATWTPTFTFTGGVARVDAVGDTSGAAAFTIEMFGPQLNEGPTPLPYAATSNKRAVYDYSGKGNHAHLGSSGVAFINPVGGAKALNLPGEAGNYASTPLTDALNFTGDLDIQVRLSVRDWTNISQDGNNRVIAGVFGEGLTRRNYAIVLYTGGQMGLWAYQADGTTQFNVSSNTVQDETGVPDGGSIWLRATHDVSTGQVTYYWAPASDDPPTSWTFWENDSPTDVGPRPAATDPMDFTIGALDDGYLDRWLDATIKRVLVFDGIDGTLVADFNPQDAHGDVAQFYSKTTGELWTINQSAATTNDPTWTGEGLQFDGADDYVQTNLVGSGALSYSTDVSMQLAFTTSDASNAQAIIGQPTFGPAIHGMGLRVFGSDLAIEQTTGGVSYNVTGSVLLDNESLLATFVRDVGNNVATLYKGSDFDATTTAPPIVSPGVEEFWIGNRPHSPNVAIHGVASAAVFYGRPLSSTDVDRNYTALKHILARRGVTT